MIYETDTNRVLIWDNAAWVMIADTDQPPGLQLVAKGTLSLTTSATNVTGVFDETKYKHYRVLLNVTARSFSNRIDMKYIVGTTASSTNYFQAGIASNFSSDATVYMQRTNNDAQFFGISTSAVTGIVMDIFNANGATKTQHSGFIAGTGSGLTFSFGGLNTLDTAFTGFQLFTATGTATVEYQVFGYSD